MRILVLKSLSSCSVVAGTSASSEAESAAATAASISSCGLSPSVSASGAGAFSGLIKVALRPPVSVDAVAAACAGAALGTVPAKVYDGTAEINGATGRPTATGLTDFLDGLKGEE